MGERRVNANWALLADFGRGVVLRYPSGTVTIYVHNGELP